MAGGVWDGAGLVFASSGFFLISGPLILAHSYNRSLFYILFYGVDDWRFGVVDQWWMILAGYYGVVVLGSVAFLFWRKHATVIYNIEQDVFDNALLQVLERNNVVWSRRGNRVEIARTTPVLTDEATLADNVHVTATPSARPAVDQPTVLTEGPPVLLHIDPFLALSNITLRWEGQGRDLRVELENDLRRVLQQTYTKETSSGMWLFGISGILFFAIVLGVLVMMLFSMMGLR